MEENKKVKKVSATYARKNLFKILDHVAEGKVKYQITKRGSQSVTVLEKEQKPENKPNSDWLKNIIKNRPKSTEDSVKYIRRMRDNNWEEDE